MNNKFYKCCTVPMCKNTTIKTPDKLFIFVPRNKQIRRLWLKSARKDPKSLNRTSNIYFCEDHFDLQNDMENYMEYTMGYVSQIRMRPGCLPTKFDCLPNRDNISSELCLQRATKRQKLERRKKERETLIKEYKNELDKNSIVIQIPRSSEHLLYIDVPSGPSTSSDETAEQDALPVLNQQNQRQETQTDLRDTVQTFENLAENEGIVVKEENKEFFETHLHIIKTEEDDDETRQEIAENTDETIHNPAFDEASCEIREEQNIPEITREIAYKQKKKFDEDKEEAKERRKVTCSAKIYENALATGVDTIIVRVYNFFKKEFDYLSKNYGDILDPTPFSKYKERTAEATGFHINVIERALREEGQNEKNSRPQKRRKKERSKDHQDSSDTESFEETIESGEDSRTRSCQPADQKDHSFAVSMEAPMAIVKEEPLEELSETPSIEAPTAIVKAEPLDELLEATSEHDSQTFENLAENEGVIVKVENQDLFKSHIIIKSEADAHKTEITENIADSIHDPAYQDSQQYRQDDRTPSSEALTAIVKAEPLDKLLEATSEHDSQTFENFAENEGVIVKVENQDLFKSHINIKTEADADKTEIAENIEDTIHNPVYQDSKQYRQDDRTPSIEVPTAIVKAEPLEELLKGSPLQGIGDIVTEHDNNQMEVDDQTTKDHVQNPRHMIGDRLNQAPKTSTERSREYRARKALLKQQLKRQLELDAIKSASEDNGTPGSSEIMTLEKKRAKSAEATRRWREKKRAANKKPAKSTAQLMREYRARKKMAASQSKQKPAVMVDSESLLATLRLMAENDPLKMETDNFECSENSDDDSDIVKEELDISDEGYG